MINNILWAGDMLFKPSPASRLADSGLENNP